MTQLRCSRKDRICPKQSAKGPRNNNFTFCCRRIVRRRGADTRDRDRGDNRSSAPPTPPYVRFRIRRFELVKLLTERPTKAGRARRVRRLAVQPTWPCSDSDAMAL